MTIATDSGGRQRTRTDGLSQATCAAVLVAGPQLGFGTKRPRRRFQLRLDGWPTIELTWLPGHSGRFWPHKDAQRCRLLRISEYRFGRSAAEWAGSGCADTVYGSDAGVSAPYGRSSLAPTGQRPVCTGCQSLPRPTAQPELKSRDPTRNGLGRGSVRRLG